MDEIKAKQQVVEKIKESAKILVTVSDSPSVDALSAALALTLLLDKQEKYATAIFSGETPPAIAFLEPQKTFDDTTDSLRDFIIALNKEKADHLRYKVEGESVKIFITPYKTTIDQNDLDFSQGDYNVELVIALGVDNQDHLDKALEDHGQILHDAAIITMTAGDQTSDLGGVDWHDSSSSSLSEMVAGLAEAMKTDKKKSLLDGQVATALLTGIVAETDRFSNEHTTSRAMTVAATLMAAGADQQLIATELRAAHQIDEHEATDEPDSSDESDEPEDQSDDEPEDIETPKADGSIQIAHEELPTIETVHQTTPEAPVAHMGETLADLDRRVLGEDKAKEKIAMELEAAAQAAAAEARRIEEAAARREQPVPEAQPVAEAPISSFDPTLPPLSHVVEDKPMSEVGDAQARDDLGLEPTLGGTLNATTEQAAEDARRELLDDQNRTILSHSYLGGDEAPAGESPSGFPGTPAYAPGSMAVNDVPSDDGIHSAYALDDGPSQEALDTPGGSTATERTLEPLDPAMQAPESIAPVQQSPTPTDLGLPLPPPIPDFSQINGAGPAIPLPETPQPAILGDILTSENVPIDNTANAVADPSTAYAPEAPQADFSLPPAEEPLPAPQPGSNDPGQFQIPTGQ